MWNIVFEEEAKRDLKKLGSPEQIRISVAIAERIAVRDNPRKLGEALTGRFKGLWKYRVGDYRIIAKIEDQTITIYVIAIGHRSEIYR
jgi:mRNA interferase RelE/StbE